MDTCPQLDPALITFLEGKYKGQLPSVLQSDLHEINFLIGQQSVVTFLKSVAKVQEMERTDGG